MTGALLPSFRRRCRAGVSSKGGAELDGHAVDTSLVEDGEVAVGLHRDLSPLDDSSLTEDPPIGDLGHPTLEHRFLVDQRGSPVPQPRRTVGPMAPTMALAAVRMMSKVAASAAPWTQPGAPS